MSEKLEVRLVPESICLRVPFGMAEICRKVPNGFFYAPWKCWCFTRNQDTARNLITTFGEQMIGEANGEGQAVIALADLPPVPRPQDSVAVPCTIPGLKTEPWAHQRQAYAFAQGKQGVMLAMGMGTGKSLTTVALLHNKELVLVLCPKSVRDVWPLEFARHASYQAQVVPLSGSSCKVKVGQLATLLRRRKSDTSGTHLIVVCNYDSAWREPLASALMSVSWSAIVLDECHKIKASGGKQSRYCGELRKKHPQTYVYGLTGTPMPHSPLDIYAQYRAIDQSIFGCNYSKFRMLYAVMGGFGGKQVIAYRNNAELRAKFLSIAYQAGRDVVSLPQATHTRIAIDLSPSARKVYGDISKDFYAAVQSGEVTASNALVKLLRLQQITGGTLKLDDGSIVQVDTSKQEALEDLIEGMGQEPCVVFCRFSSDIQAVFAVCSNLQVSCCQLSGAENQLKAWQNAMYQVIAVQIQAGGAGIDLTRAHFCVYYSLSFSLGEYDQSLARCHRPGQKSDVSYYHLVAKSTIDEQIYTALAHRRDVVDTILKEHIK